MTLYKNLRLKTRTNRKAKKSYKKKHQKIINPAVLHKRGFKYNPSLVLNKTPHWMPDRYMTKMKFHDERILRYSVTTFGSQVYRMNSVYDPDFTNTGNHCYGFNQLCSIYKYYRVYASSIKIMFVPHGATITSSNAQIRVVLLPAMGSLSSVATDLAQLQEFPFAKWYLGNAFNDTKGSHTLKQSLTTARIVGEDKLNIHSNSNYVGLMGGGTVTTPGSSPNTQAFWNIFVDSVTSASGEVFLSTEITYMTEFFGRKDLFNDAGITAEDNPDQIPDPQYEPASDVNEGATGNPGP